jgi:preprotein translocase subunit SecD
MRAGTSLTLACILALSVVHPVSAEPLALDVLRANAGFDYRLREPIVSVYLRPVSIKAFFELTKANVGRSIELRLDGKTVTKTVIAEPVSGGVFQIDSDFTRDQAKEIAHRLSTGASKVEVEVIPN